MPKTVKAGFCNTNIYSLTLGKKFSFKFCIEYEVKWALGSITMNNARGGDGSPVKLFQIIKDATAKYASKFGKLSSGHRTGLGKCQFSFQSPKKDNKKEC